MEASTQAIEMQNLVCSTMNTTFYEKEKMSMISTPFTECCNFSISGATFQVELWFGTLYFYSDEFNIFPEILATLGTETASVQNFEDKMKILRGLVISMDTINTKHNYVRERREVLKNIKMDSNEEYQYIKLSFDYYIKLNAKGIADKLKAVQAEP